MMTYQAWLILSLCVVGLNWPVTAGSPSKDSVVSAQVSVKGRNAKTDNNSSTRSSTLQKKTECHSLVIIENTNSICRPEIVGRVRFKAEQKLLEICDGSQWLSTSLQKGPVQNLDYGSIKMPGESCRDIMDHYKSALKNGVYWIRLQGERSTFPVYCDMVNGGWTMVFKAVSGASSVPADLWFAPIATNENDLSALELSSDFKKSYKNRIINKWRDFSPSEARVVLFRHSDRILQITFNAAYSDNANWFSMSKVTDSPWTDLAKEPHNFFSITGYQDNKQNARSFHINRNYGGCGNDAGWLVTTFSACSWERRFPLNSILYSKTGRNTKWDTYENVGFADVLAVFVR